MGYNNSKEFIIIIKSFNKNERFIIILKSFDNNNNITYKNPKQLIIIIYISL